MDKPIFRIEYGGATTIKTEVDISAYPVGAKITEYIPKEMYENLRYQKKCLDDQHRELLLRHEELENKLYHRDTCLSDNEKDIERYKNIIDFILETR